jgi:hypothetical protein
VTLARVNFEVMISSKTSISSLDSNYSLVSSYCHFVLANCKSVHPFFYIVTSIPKFPFLIHSSSEVVVNPGCFVYPKMVKI